VPSRLPERIFTPRALLVVSALFILYATTIPWDFAPPPDLRRIDWTPFWDEARQRIPSLTDFVQNIVLFVPFGFFGWLSFARARRRGWLLGSLMVGLAGLALSFPVEFLQTMSASRTASSTDLVTNFSGAFGGAVLGAIFTRRMLPRLRVTVPKILREQPGILVTSALAGAIAWGTLEPFLPTLDVSTLKASVKALLRDPWGPKAWPLLMGDALLYAALAVSAAMELPTAIARRKNRPQPDALSSALIGFLFAAGLAIALECVQVMFRDHRPSVQDAFAGVTGAALGTAIAYRWPPRPATALGDLARRRRGACLAFALLLPALSVLSPFEFEPWGDALAGVGPQSFVPFAPLFVNVNIWTFFNVFEAAAIFLPLGYILAAWRLPPLRSAILCFVYAELLEFAQIAVVGRTYDVTVGLYAASMGLLGAWIIERGSR
jgi:glycopeptide antibiotics resistance protein